MYLNIQHIRGQIVVIKHLVLDGCLSMFSQPKHDFINFIIFIQLMVFWLN